MTEQEVLQRIEKLQEALQDGLRQLELVGLTREERASLEQQLDRVYARFDQVRERLAELRALAS